MLKVYVCGPYRARTVDGMRRNIRAAEEAAWELWKLGAAPFCPHLNSAFMDGAVRDEAFLQGYLEWLEDADVLLVLSGAGLSRGAQMEIEYAESLQIPVIRSIQELKRFLRHWPSQLLQVQYVPLVGQKFLVRTTKGTLPCKVLEKLPDDMVIVESLKDGRRFQISQRRLIKWTKYAEMGSGT